MGGEIRGTRIESDNEGLEFCLCQLFKFCEGFEDLKYPFERENPSVSSVVINKYKIVLVTIK